MYKWLWPLLWPFIYTIVYSSHGNQIWNMIFSAHSAEGKKIHIILWVYPFLAFNLWYHEYRYIIPWRYVCIIYIIARAELAIIQENVLFGYSNIQFSWRNYHRILFPWLKHHRIQLSWLKNYHEILLVKMFHSLTVCLMPQNKKQSKKIRKKGTTKLLNVRKKIKNLQSGPSKFKYGMSAILCRNILCTQKKRKNELINIKTLNKSMHMDILIIIRKGFSNVSNRLNYIHGSCKKKKRNRLAKVWKKWH